MTPSILFLNRVYPPDSGASGRVLADLAGRFVAAGWQVTVVAGNGPSDAITPGGIHLVRTAAAHGRGTAAIGRQLAALGAAALRLPRPDLAMTMTDPPLLALLGPLLRRRGTATVHWCHDLYPDLLPVLGRPLPPPLPAALARAVRWAMAGHDAIVAIGRCMAARLGDGGIGHRRILTVPNWPDPVIVPNDPAAAALRAELGLRDRFIAMYAGNFGLAHRFAGLLAAAAALRDRRPDLAFVMAGDGARGGEVAAAVRRDGLHNVRLLPLQPRARLSALLGAADVHLATMASEAAGCMVPCKVYGALAAGRPCLLLGPDHGEAAELLVRSGAGAVLAPDDGAALAAWLQRLTEDAAARHAMAHRAPAAVAPYALDRAAAAFLHLGAELVGAAGARTAPAALDPRPALRGEAGHG